MRKKNSLACLVFEGHHPARTFLISPTWLSKIGLALMGMAALTLVSLSFCVRFYRIASKSSPARIYELEQKIAELNAVKNPAPQATGGAPEPGYSPVESQPGTTSGEALEAEPGIFTAVSTKVSKLVPVAQNSIEISDISAIWQGKNLNLKFNIKYIRRDGGNQQGKILVLARGPDLLSVYPSGALNPPGSPSLLALEKGEYFSVSRFRETKAEFGPVIVRNSVRDIEILIISQDNQLLIHQTLKVGENGVLPAEQPSATPETKSP